MQIFSSDGNGDLHSDGDWNTKKVCFKDNFDEEASSMAVDSDPPPKLLWKEKLLGWVGVASNLDSRDYSTGIENEIELLDGDINTSVIDGVPTIAFSNHVREILFNEMKLTVILKFLGCNIGYNALYSRIINLWKPIKPIHVMDVANGFFLL